ncbi:MAG: GH92 family glycosyl hydrolase, partial [Bifidobacteriaceae bacterium]|nr:GH92 family glycosyl hydrolase [Bifidobacteriaceae bacterium]
SNIVSSTTEIVDNRTVLAQTRLSNFCQGTEPFTVYTKTVFSRPFDLTASTTWAGGTIPGTPQSANTAQRTGAMLRFDVTADQTVTSQTSISYVDAAGAALNLAAEDVQGDFDHARASANATWEGRLGNIQITSTDTDQIRSFYSALYRAYLAPNISDDVDGRFRGWGAGIEQIHSLTDPDVGLAHYYQNFSLWDTYRTQEQFLALIAPVEAMDQVKSLVLHGEYGGWAPRWTYGPVETNIMTGDPVTVFLAAAYDQGLLPGAWGERAYQMLKPSLDGVPPAATPYNGRQGNAHYIPFGVVPLWTAAPHKAGDWDYDHGPSTTLEYTLSDGMVSRMAASLGHTADAARYAQRGQNYKAMWDPAIRHTYTDTGLVVDGGFQARGTDGAMSTVRTLVTADTRFHEGTEPQYEFIATHDIPGVISLMGGAAKAVERLDHLFRYPELVADPYETARCGWVGRCSPGGSMDYYSSGYYNPNNEPDIAFPFAYSWVGQPWKTADIVDASKYLYTPTPDGMTGNDDLGTMSGWQVLTSLGLFPMAPGADIWGITTPAFTEIDVKIDRSFYKESSGLLQIRAPQRADGVHYIQSFRLAGQAVDRSYVTGPELLSGSGALDFTIGATPSAWATSANANPGSLAPDPGVHADRATLNRAATVLLAPGGSATATPDFLIQGDGAVAGAFALPAGSPLQITGSPEFSVQAAAGGALSHAAVPVTVKAPTGTPRGVYTVTTESWGETRTAVTVAVGGDAWQEHLATAKSIASPGSAAADVDGAGHYILDAALAEVGAAPGVPRTFTASSNTFHYTIPATADNEPDTILAAGQTLDIPSGLGAATHIAFVGFSAATAAATFTATLQFSDATSQTL